MMLHISGLADSATGLGQNVAVAALLDLFVIGDCP